MVSSTLLFILSLICSFCSQVPAAKNKFITQEAIPNNVPECLELLENSLVEHQFTTYLVTKDATAEGVKESKKLWIDSWIVIRLARKKWELGSCHYSLIIKNLGKIINDFRSHSLGICEETKVLSESSYSYLPKKEQDYYKLKAFYNSKLKELEIFSGTGVKMALASGWMASLVKVQLVLLDMILVEFREMDYEKIWENISGQMSEYNFILSAIIPVPKLLLELGPNDLSLNEIFDEMREGIDISVLNLREPMRFTRTSFPEWAFTKNVPLFLAHYNALFIEKPDEFEMNIIARSHAIKALGRLYKGRKNQLSKTRIKHIGESFGSSSDDINISIGLFFFVQFIDVFNTPEERAGRILQGVEDALKNLKCLSEKPNSYAMHFADMCYIKGGLRNLQKDQFPVNAQVQTYLFVERRLRSIVSALDSIGIENGERNLSLHKISDSESLSGFSILCSNRSISQFQYYSRGKGELGDLLIDLYNILVWVQSTLADFKKTRYKINDDADIHKYEAEFKDYTKILPDSSTFLEDIEEASSIIFEIHRGTWPEKVPKSFQGFFLNYYTPFKLHNFVQMKNIITTQPGKEKNITAEKAGKNEKEATNEFKSKPPPQTTPQTGRSHKKKRGKAKISPSAPRETVHDPANAAVTTSKNDPANPNLESCSSTQSTTAENVELRSNTFALVTTLVNEEPSESVGVEINSMPATVSLNPAEDADKETCVPVDSSNPQSYASSEKVSTKEISVEESMDDIPLTESVVCSSEGTASEGKEEEQEVEHDQDEGEETDSTTTSDPDTSQLFHILTCIDYDDLENAGDAVDPRDIAMAYILIGEKIYTGYLRKFITLTGCKSTLYKSQDAFEACIRTHYIMQPEMFKDAMARTRIPSVAYLWKSIRFYRKRNQFVNQMTPMFKKFRAKIIRMNLEILNVYAEEQAAGVINLPAISLAPILSSYKEHLANRLTLTGSTCEPIRKDGRPDTFLTPELTEITLAVLSLHRFVTYGKTKGDSEALLQEAVFDCRHQLAHLDVGEEVLGSYVAHIFANSPDFEFLTWLINVNAKRH